LEPSNALEISGLRERSSLADGPRRVDGNDADRLMLDDPPGTADGSSQSDTSNEYDVLAVGEGDLETV
jgi:hypothetical protein